MWLPPFIAGRVPTDVSSIVLLLFFIRLRRRGIPLRRRHRISFRHTDASHLLCLDDHGRDWNRTGPNWSRLDEDAICSAEGNPWMPS